MIDFFTLIQYYGLSEKEQLLSIYVTIHAKKELYNNNGMPHQRSKTISTIDFRPRIDFNSIWFHDIMLAQNKTVSFYLWQEDKKNLANFRKKNRFEWIFLEVYNNNESKQQQQQGKNNYNDQQ